jgi:plasmid stability protein
MAEFLCKAGAGAGADGLKVFGETGFSRLPGRVARFAIFDIIHLEREESEMADLLVRGVDEELVRALQVRAEVHGRSPEAEHREILAAALTRPRRRSFAEVLAAMPQVGTDADFERVDSTR